MTEIQVLPPFIDAFKTIATQMGLADLVGGPEVLERGLSELQDGSDPLLAECIKAEKSGIDLSEAVRMGDVFPHLTTFHGVMYDVCFGDGLAPLTTWVEKVLQTLSAVPQVADEVKKAFAVMVGHGTNRTPRSLGPFARLILFEVLTICQRLELKRQGVRIEEQGGRHQDPEVISNMEIEIASKVPEYGECLREQEDPLSSLLNTAFISLQKHLGVLRDELVSITDSVSRENIEMRKEVLDIMDQLSRDEALIVRNESAKIFEGEQVTAEQLRIMHPVTLGGHSADAIYQKIHRLPEKISRIRSGELTVSKQPSLADVLLGFIKERG